MHSRKKGESGSTKPSIKKNPTWLSYSEKEVEHFIIKLAKEEKSTSQIGMILRDTYGIPDVKLVIKKSITGFLKEQKLLPKIPEDLLSLIKKHIIISKHLETHKKDQPSKRGLTLTESKLLKKEYKDAWERVNSTK